MNAAQLQAVAIEPALFLLPSVMHAREARITITAIALQESALRHRAQVPSRIARGLWQFERLGGVRGVLEHHATAEHARRLCEALIYEPEIDVVYDALEHNDVLAAGMARLLLWTLPKALPTTEQEGWDQYLEAWRAGRPHPDTWPANWRRAVEAVTG